MPPQNPALVEVYEDRIARLEEGVTDVKVDLGVVKTRIDDGVKMLAEKLDAVASLHERVTVLETTEKVKAQAEAHLEADRARRRERRMLILKVGATAGSLFFAALGIFLKIVFGG
jgi:hypothetical protein